MPHTDIEYVSFREDTGAAMCGVIRLLYRGLAIPANPLSLKIKEKTERNANIRQRFREGESLRELANAFAIFEQRVHQIIYGYS